MSIFKKKLIPYTVPQSEPNTVPLIIKKFLSGTIYNGPELAKFEREFARYIDVKHAICFASGRYALYLIYKFFNCNNKNVILPSYTCIPAIDAARWAGAIPVFLDIDLDTYNPIFDKSLHKLKNVGAISLSYLYGLVGDLDPFLEFGRKNNIPIVEDAAICIGGYYKNRKVGLLGDAAMFSLQSSKILTAWKGGIVTTNNDKLYEFLCEERKKQPWPPIFKLLFNTSFTYLRTLFSHPRIYGFTMYPLKKILCSKTLKNFLEKIMEQNPLEAIDGRGYGVIPDTEKYRFTNLQAAIALSSFKKIDLIIKKRRQIAKMILEELKDENRIELPKENVKVKHAYGRFPIRIPGLSKYCLNNELLKQGIETALNYPYICPNTLFMKKYNFNPRDYPNAMIAAKETVLLPFHVFIKKKDIILITKAIKKIIKERKFRR